MLTNLLENLLTNLIEPLIEGGESDGFLAFTFGGNVPYYTLYTREGDATAELADGTPVTVAQDIPPFEYSAPEDSTNLVPNSSDPSKWCVDGGASYSDGVFTLPQYSGIAFVNETPSITDAILSAGVSVEVIQGSSDLIFSIRRGTVDSDETITTTGYYSATNNSGGGATNTQLVVQNNGATTAKVIFSEPQLNQSSSLLAYEATLNGKKIGAVGQKLFRQSYSTDNPGTTSLQINDIEAGAYQFNGTSDRITLDNPVILGTSDFNFKFTGRPTDITNRSITGELENGAFIVRINSGGTISIIESGVSTVYTSTLTVSVDEDIDIEYDRLYSGTSTLTVNGASESVTDNRNYDGQNGILFSRLVGEYFEGYVFTAKLIVDSVTNFDYSFNQYRRDTEIVDRSGNGNNGTSARTVDNLLVENSGFGVTGEDARKPFTYTYADGGMFMGGLRELFYGAGVGSDLIRNGSFDTDTDWNKGSGWTIEDGKASFNGGPDSNLEQISVHNFVPDERYLLSIDLSDSTTGSLSIRVGNTSVVLAVISGNKTHEIYLTIQSAGQNVLIRSISGFDGSIDNVSIREVSPAIGTILFKNLTLHSTSTDVTLLEGQNGTAVVWFDSAASKIKITDGTNTAESANIVTQSVNIPELRIVLNETEMWITDTTQGTIVSFVGYLPELGNRAIAVSDDEYLTVGDVLVDDDLAFDYVYHNGELVTHNGEPVIVYR